MRDPAASLQFEADKVVRHLRQPLEQDHFLRSSLAQTWIQRGDLVPFHLVDEGTVSARRLPFVSIPAEWTDRQLHAAGQLTLALQREAVQAGYDLKDASAWNVIFDGPRPVFCDLLSFDRLTRKAWWAAGQFSRHFVSPLLLSRRRGLLAHKAFLAWRDGVPDDVAREMLGVGRFLTRYWPLMAGGKPPSGDTAASAAPGATLHDIQAYRGSLDKALGWMMKGLGAFEGPGRATVWGNYVNERGHYSDSDLSTKRGQLATWFERTQPGWVLDLGCNSGEFSRMAADHGAHVIAVDGDHEAVQRGVARCSERVNFLVAALDDLRGGFGWQGAEHTGLSQRLEQSADMTLVLALMHHLIVGASIPLDALARFLASTARRWMVVELIKPEDSQVRLLQAQRDRVDAYPSLEAQLQMFQQLGFVPRDQCELPSGARVLTLFERACLT